MGGEAGVLSIKISADDAELIQALANSRAAISDTKKEIKDGSAEFNKYGGAAVIGIGVATAALVKHSIDTADALNKQQQMTGVAVDKLQELQYAAQLADVEQEELNKSLVKLTAAARESNDIHSKQSAAFKALGISVHGANGEMKSADVLFLEISDHFKNMADDTTKVNIATDLFGGKLGYKLIPTLNSGSEAIKALGAEARAAGTIISAETAAQAEEFNDSLTKLGKNITAVGNAMASEWLPKLNNVTAAMIEAKKESGLLRTAWIGLGGLLAEGLGLNDDKDVVAAEDLVKGLTQQLGVAQQALQGWGTAQNPIVDNLKKNIADLQVQIKSATAARDQLVKPTDTPKPKAAEKPDLEAAEAANKKLAEQQAKEKAAAEAIEKHREAIGKQVKELQLQAETLNFSASQAALYKMQLDGATETQLKSAAAAYKMIDAQAGLKKIGEIKTGGMQGNDRAVAELQEKYAELNKIIAQNPELQKQAAEAAAVLAQQYQNSVDAEREAGLKANDDFVQQMKDRAKAINDSSDTEIAVSEKKYALEQEDLEEALLNRAITEDEYNQISLKNQSLHDNDMSNMRLKGWKDIEQITSLSWKTQASIVSGSLADMTAGLASKNKTMFEINKVAAAANAAVRIPSMMAGAFDAMVGIPYVGPVLAVAAAAAAGAFGAAQVQSILSTSYGSGAKSTSAGVPSAANSVPGGDAGAPAPRAQSHTLSVQGLDPGALFDGKTVRALAQQLVDYQRDGGKVVLAA